MLGHMLIRPPVGATDVQAVIPIPGAEIGYGTLPDNGTPAYAFSGLIGAVPYAWYGPCKCTDSGAPGCRCPAHLAMQHTAQRYGAANGQAMPPTTRRSRKAGILGAVLHG